MSTRFTPLSISMRSCCRRCRPEPTCAGRSLSDIERIATVFVVTGHDEIEIEQAMGRVRQQIAFYASTPDYAAVLELHGWDFAEKLRAMSRRGEWAEMAAVIPDDMIAEVAVVAPLDELGSAIRARYGDRLQRVGYYVVDGAESWAPGDWSQLISDTRG